MKLRIDEIKVHFTIPMIEQSKYATILCKIVWVSIYLSDIILIWAIKVLIGAIIIVLFSNNVLAVEKFDLSSFILLNGQ